MRNLEKKNENIDNNLEEERLRQRDLGLRDGLLERKIEGKLSEEDEKKLKDIESKISFGFYGLPDKGDKLEFDLNEDEGIEGREINSGENIELREINRKEMVSEFNDNDNSNQKNKIARVLGEKGIEEYLELLNRRDYLIEKINEIENQSQGVSEEDLENLIERKKILEKEKKEIDRRDKNLKEKNSIFEEIDSFYSDKEIDEEDINIKRRESDISLKEGGAEYEIKDIHSENKEDLTEEDEDEPRKKSVFIPSTKQIKSMEIEMEKEILEKDKKEKGLKEKLGCEMIREENILREIKNQLEKERKSFIDNVDSKDRLERENRLKVLEKKAEKAQKKLDSYSFLSVLEWNDKEKEIESKREVVEQEMKEKGAEYETKKIYDKDSETGEMIDTGREKDVFVPTEKQMEEIRIEMMKDKKKEAKKKKRNFLSILSVFMIPIYVAEKFIKLVNSSVDKFSKK
jgi:hypothetical protein